jgi:hypothetical protein
VAIKKNLFATRSEPEGFINETHLWRLLAPGLALFLGLCMLNSRNTPTLTPFISSSTGLVATVALANPQLASYCANSAYTEHNVWPVTSFEWTNGSGTLSPSGPYLDTNHLTP